MIIIVNALFVIHFFGRPLKYQCCKFGGLLWIQIHLIYLYFVHSVHLWFFELFFKWNAMQLLHSRPSFHTTPLGVHFISVKCWKKVFGIFLFWLHHEMASMQGSGWHICACDSVSFNFISRPFLQVFPLLRQLFYCLKMSGNLKIL